MKGNTSTLFGVIIVCVFLLGAFYIFGDDSPPISHGTPSPTASGANAPTDPLPEHTPFFKPLPPNSPTPTETPTVTPTETPTVTPTETPTVTPTETPTVTPTETPTVTPTVTPTETPTVMPKPISPLPPMPPLPVGNNCNTQYQRITMPKDGGIFEEGDEILFLEGAANWPDFWKYQIDIYTPDGVRHSLNTVESPVTEGKLWTWNFEDTTVTYGGGWYIIRLLVVQTGGNYIEIGNQDGCHIRVYLPPPS